MKTQRQSVDVAKGRQRHPADRSLADLCEDGVAQLVKALRHHPGEAVGDDQGHRHRDHDLRGRKGVNSLFVEKGNADDDELAGEQKHQGEHDPHAQPEGTAPPEDRRGRFERAQLVLETALLARWAKSGKRMPVRAHRVGSAGSAPVSFATPRPRVSLHATTRAAPTSTAPHKTRAFRRNSPKKNPAAAGPSTRERLPTDCDTPNTSPCSSRPARREIRLLSEGCVRPMPSASALMARTSTAKLRAVGIVRSPTPISARPQSSRRSSPKRRVRGPISPP